MKFKNSNELFLAVLKLFPTAELGEDSDGQIVIYTNLTETPNGVEDMGDIES